MDLVAAMADPNNVTLRLFLTGTGDNGVIEHGQLPNHTFGRRILPSDIIGALDGYRQNVFGAEHDRRNTVCYVCGPPQMTDELVDLLRNQKGMCEDRVLCEKWW